MIFTPFKRYLVWLIATGVLFTAGVVIAQQDVGFMLRMVVYQHTPEVFADRWRGPVPVNPQIPLGIPWNAIWYVKYEGRLNFANLPEVVKLVKERKIPGIDLSGQRDIMYPDMSQLRDLTDLRYLNVSGTRIVDRDLIDLFQLTNLQVLILNDRITDDGMENLQRLTRLSELSLSGAQVTDKGLTVVRGFPQLERLDLSGTGITDAGLQVLKTLPLKQLRLGPKISDAGITTLRSIPTLVQLDLAQTQVTDQGLPSLSVFPRLHTLFASHATSDIGLAAIAKLHGLRRLDLTSTRVTDAGMPQLAQLIGLEELSLARTAVSDAGMTTLTGLPHLRYLEVSESSVTLKGVERLVGMKALQVISFSNAAGKLKLGALRPLAAISTLRTIIVNGRALPYEAMQYLQKHAPKTSWQKFFDALVPELAADEEPTIPLSDDTDVEQLTQKKGVAATQLVGLPRIHSVESQLDDVIPAPSDINEDNQQDTQKNFLGEFSVGVEGKKNK